MNDWQNLWPELSTTSRSMKVCGLRLLMCVLCLGWIGSTGADELMTVTSEPTSKAASSAEASREIQMKALAGTARDLTIEMIGEARYTKNRALVESKIVKEAPRFIPFVVPGELVRTPDGGFKAQVELKVSTVSLRKLIMDLGLLSDGQTPVSILPMLAVTDRSKTLSYRWWNGDGGDPQRQTLMEWHRDLQITLHRELMRQGFHLLLQPEGSMSSILPMAFKVERASQQDVQDLGQLTGASMVMRGDLRVRESKEVTGAWTVQIKMVVDPVVRGRSVAEVSRSYETEIGPTEVVVRKVIQKEAEELSKDLATQVFEAWSRGTLTTTPLRLAIRGQFSPQQLVEIRQLLQRAHREIKAIRERSIEQERVDFEIDWSSTPQAFVEKMKAMDLPGYQEKVSSDSQGSGDGSSAPFFIELKSMQ
jgi:hypothetical protein